jgi:hypothetical protein
MSDIFLAKKRARISMLPRIEVFRPTDYRAAMKKDSEDPMLMQLPPILSPAGVLTGTWSIDTKRPKTWYTLNGGSDHFSVKAFEPVSLKINLRGGKDIAKLYICTTSNLNSRVEVVSTVETFVLALNYTLFSTIRDARGLT